MIIIGHRGAAGLAPENTRASFKAAIHAGVDWIEFDVRRTKDGHIVVSHDSHTIRTGKRAKIIKKTSYAKLRNVKLRGGHTMPTIAEAFNSIDTHAKINIEIKSPGCAQAVVHNVERFVKRGVPISNFTVSSFATKNLREVHKLNSKIPLALLHTAANPYAFLRLRGFRVQAVGFSKWRVPKRAIQQAKVRELFTYVYTIDKLSVAKKLQQKGIDAIVTNRPDKLVSIQASKQSQH